jgi:hypothetical protein
MSKRRFRSGRSVVWSPHQIPRGLMYGWVDFARSELLTISSGVQNLIDPISGTTFTQATAASRPTAPVNGWAAFDGTADNLEYTAGAISWPNSGEFEVWAVADMGTAATTKTIVSWPNTSTGTGFQLRASSAHTAQIVIGNGSASTTFGGTNGGALGRRLWRVKVHTEALVLSIDGVEATTTAVVPAFSGATRHRIGAATGVSASNFWSGSINCIFITRRLPTAIATRLYTYLAARRDAA